MVRRRRSSLLASGARDLQERALQEHGDLAHLARQLAAEKAIVGPISVGGSSRTINQWPGVGCLLHVPFWGFWKKKSITEMLHHFHVLVYLLEVWKKWICNFEISINSLYFAFAWSLSHLPRLRGVGRTFSSNPGAVCWRTCNSVAAVCKHLWGLWNRVVTGFLTKSRFGRCRPRS